MASVTLRNLTKQYTGNNAPSLHALNLEITDGEFVCLVGPSGCGKTTALRMIAGLEDVTSGEIEIGDRVVNDLPSRDRDIALVFQSYALYPHLTVADNMSFGLKLRKVPKAEIEQAVQSAAKILDLVPLLARKPAQLSGGQRQRVALGRALVRDPAVFLMDEPLSNLDAKLRVQTRAEIAQLHHRLQATMLYVTHDQVEAMTMADRIAVMNLGVLEQYGSPRELYNFPNNLFVAGFIGSPSMNFVTMRLNRDAERIFLAGVSADSKIKVTLTDEQSSVLDKSGASEVVVGVRPEHLKEGSLDGAGFSAVAQVQVIEFLGNDEHIHVTSDDMELVAILNAHSSVARGDSITLSAPPDRVHFFDPTSGLRLNQSA
ncbi:MAG TPA: sn-glycerol-3-phosphate ABC transporter ATP-binding protein UgpC [Acidimicrobiales bacterium]|nr:sn-glycerol-3-phosphate ABC transporter ATP-binding protein UgpC [Acidimicrobiales bacterium]